MHLTDEQLNEYLDNESADRAAIAAHVDSCADCARRLAALQALFTELDSLPEAALTVDLAARFLPDQRRAAPLPAWLTLTATLQAALALIAGAAALPLLLAWLPRLDTSLFNTWLVELQSLQSAWQETISTFQLPALQPLPIPVLELSTLLMVLAGASIVWVLGNGLLLRNRHS